MFKAYVVKHASDGFDDFDESVIVYHVTEEAAHELGRHQLTCGNAWDETAAERAPQHDARCVQMTEPDTEDDPEYLRLHGWGYEGEKSCDSCGFKAHGVKEFAVCETSQMCIDCGCEPNEDGTPCVHPEGLSCEGLR